jgi:AraC family transcriptional regulator, regulatory protein of adaptative response / methylated-DNA-[protein]-cysteine methyltransferase
MLRALARGIVSIVIEPVYAVRTTGIYCRLSCPSRRPRPENVVHYASGTAAQAAGFRACKRCRPDVAELPSAHAAAIAEACRVLLVRPATLVELAANAGLSTFYFQKVFKATVGVTPKQFAMAQRSRRAEQALSQAETVTDAVYRAGFESPSRFYATVDLGMAPATFRRQGLGERIRYACAGSTLGWVLVAASERGVCAVLLGDEPARLIEDLRRRFANAELAEADREFAETVTNVLLCIETPQASILPLDMQGTAFQQRVWKALQLIPRGQTVDYSELARRMQMPKSARAVARACAANPLAVVVPCHRVIRRDGSLAGYRWGVERKQELLRREGSDD